MDHFDEVADKAVVYGLDGTEVLGQLGADVARREYNGIGPEFFPAALREKVTAWLAMFEPAALIHDLRNYMSDGRRWAFNYANYEFLENCRKCAAAKYRWWSWRRWRARAVARVLYDFVSGPAGWKAWMDCYEKKPKQRSNMKKLIMLAALAAMVAGMSGCGTPGKLRDVELKGMYVNGYSEQLAIGMGRLTSIPGEREAFVAHYREDTAWLSPSTKTHELDLMIVGTNSTDSAAEVIASICNAFKDVAPSIAKINAEAPKGITVLDVIKPSDAALLAKAVGSKAYQAFVDKGGDAAKATVAKMSDGSMQISDGSTCINCDPSGNCTDCSIK